jgi:hypothetical protein
MALKKRQQPNSTSDRLVRAATLYHREAKKCLRGKAYLAAVVMQVAVLEAGLQAMCSMYGKDVKKTSVYQKKKFRRQRDRCLELTLDQLIRIARELQWFPAKRITWAGKRADLTGFTHEIRKLRNFVHPSRIAMERENTTKFSKGTYDVVFEIFDVASSWLVHRVERSIRRSMEREEKRK